MFVTDEKVSEIANNLLSDFEVGDLHSRSSLREIARHARDELADNGLPTRKSLCFVVAKIALANWVGTVDAHKGRS